MPPSGDQGRNAMPSSAQCSSSSPLDRNVGENWFCTEASRPPRMSLARSIRSTLAFEIPASSMTPSSSRSRIAPMIGVRHLRDPVDGTGTGRSRRRRGAARTPWPPPSGDRGDRSRSTSRHRVADGRPSSRRGRRRCRRRRTAGPGRSAPRCDLPRRHRGGTRPRCRSASRRHRGPHGWSRSTARWSGRPSIDIGMPPSPIEETLRGPISRCCT